MPKRCPAQLGLSNFWQYNLCRLATMIWQRWRSWLWTLAPSPPLSLQQGRWRCWQRFESSDRSLCFFVRVLRPSFVLTASSSQKEPGCHKRDWQSKPQLWGTYIQSLPQNWGIEKSYLKSENKKGGAMAHIDINFEHTNPKLIDWFNGKIFQSIFNS